MKKINKKKTFFWLASVIIILYMILMGPMDIFRTGYFREEVDLSQILESDYQGEIDLADQDYDMVFSPKKPYMTGIELYFKNQPSKNSGEIKVNIADEKGNTKDTVLIELSTVRGDSWYKVYTSADLKQGQKYKLTVSAENCEVTPHLQKVKRSYLPAENVEGDALISFAYKHSTFTFQNKALICMFLIALWLFLAYKTFDIKGKKCFGIAAVILFMTTVLAWNYEYNSIDSENKKYEGFQANSESLVLGMIYADKDGEYFRNESDAGFGLGGYCNLKGWLRNSRTDNYITDDDWYNGYSRTECAIKVTMNPYSLEVATAGNWIQFADGSKREIIDISDDGTNIIMKLDGERISYGKNGSLDNAIFLNAKGEQFHKSLLQAYTSQYGLQGKVFKHLARLIGNRGIVSNLNLLCCVITAFVFAVIVVLLAKKYNEILAVCFFVTFWLSPWIINFARNLYWVEFTWFIPMAVGIFCAWKISSRKCRIASYVMAYIAITAKCLCGYEYISVIMMGLIAFLLADLVKAVADKDKDKIKLEVRTILIIGIVAVCGFATAICMHAPLRGNGDLIAGIKSIFEHDVLRRTVGGDLNEFATSYWDSFNASVWTVFCQYFHFSTEVITGIGGNLFPILCVIPLCIFGAEARNKHLNVELFAMYIIFFLTAESWFILAKSHSYIHTHMNYVLWYFGFIQICFYIIVNKIVQAFKSAKEKNYK